jgi:hypothetical protein
MVGGEVITVINQVVITKGYLTPCEPDVGVLASPGTESLQLAFGLTHPCTEEVEFAQSCCAGLGVAVDRVEANVIAMVSHSNFIQKTECSPLMVLDKANYIVFFGSVDQGIVVGKQLCRWFGN